MRRPERASFFEVDGIGAEWTGTEWKGWREEDWPGLERMGRNGRSG